MQPDEIKRYRRGKEWSQQQMADFLKVSIHTVQSWEQGKNPMPASIAQVLNMQRDLKIPLEMMAEIAEESKRSGRGFEEVLFAAIKAGLAQAPKSGKPGKKGS